VGEALASLEALDALEGGDKRFQNSPK